MKKWFDTSSSSWAGSKKLSKLWHIALVVMVNVSQAVESLPFDEGFLQIVYDDEGL